MEELNNTHSTFDPLCAAYFIVHINSFLCENIITTQHCTFQTAVAVNVLTYSIFKAFHLFLTTKPLQPQAILYYPHDNSVKIADLQSHNMWALVYRGGKGVDRVALGEPGQKGLRGFNVK